MEYQKKKKMYGNIVIRLAGYRILEYRPGYKKRLPVTILLLPIREAVFHVPPPPAPRNRNNSSDETYVYIRNDNFRPKIVEKERGRMQKKTKKITRLLLTHDRYRIRRRYIWTRKLLLTTLYIRSKITRLFRGSHVFGGRF